MTAVSVLDRLTSHIRERKLLQPKETVLVAYSGGADSTFLLTLLQEAAQYDVVAAHLHHGQRPEADEEVAQCQAYCDALGVPLVVGRADVPLMASHLGMGLEEAGRHARYAFLNTAAKSLGATKIATGHTLDDHVETVFINLLRGTGLAGLGGIPESRDQIIRPIRIFRRAETREFCRERGLWFHDDPANTDTRHLRSRIRLELMPLMESIEPSFVSQVARMASTAQEEDAFLDQAAGALLQSAEEPLNGDLAFLTQDLEAKFRLDTLRHSPPVLAKRAIRVAAKFLGSTLNSAQTHLIYDGIVSCEKGSVTSEGGEVVFAWDAESMHVQVAEAETPSRYPLVVPGETESEVFGFKIVANSVAGGTQPGGIEAVLAVELVKGGLHLRGWLPGDRIEPAQRNGTKKVADLFQEARLTPLARRRLPIVCDMLGPVWVPGCAVAKRAQPTDSTARALRLSLEPVGDAWRHDS